MKKQQWLLSIVLMLSICFMLSACQSSTPSEETSSDTPSTEPTSQEMNQTLTALEVAHLMGNGTNLGNTMEAFGRKQFGTDAPISDYETYWGQPITTPEMLKAMKAAGFDSIRIPVAWTNTMNYEEGDYTIAEAYLDRVEEITNYALDADMYVVINDHWDGGWWGMFGSKTQETRDNAMALYKAMWTQVAERFKGYSEKVILESANEELGNRLNDADVASDSGGLSEDECYALTNEINQTFVDLIRSTGGNNAYRFLLIAGYNTDIEKTCDDRFQMPKDSAANRLLLSVHYYTPWSYCGTDSVANWGTEKHYETQNELLKKMTKYTDQGYGIIIGEYAALPKADGSLKNNTVDFTKNMLDNCDLYGYVPMLWDCSGFFIRTELKIPDESLANLFVSRNVAAQSAYSQDELKQKAETNLANALAYAKENGIDSALPVLDGSEQAIAWLMFNSNDYELTYAVGDVYDPYLRSEGVVPTDVVIEGPGTYTVGLDFTQTAKGYANSTSFSALGISNGELLFPGYIIQLLDVVINGESYKLKGVPYTTADDDICTRVNLYNGWVTEIPETARVANPNMRSFMSATPLEASTLGNIETIEITFTYSEPK